MSKLVKMSTVSIVVLIISCGVLAMTVTGIGKVCLFSNMSGVVEFDGKPVANARLIRTVDFSGAQTDTFKTDKNGKFEMPAIFKRTVTKYLPQEFVASQKVIVNYQGQEYRIWYSVKRTPEENSESRGKPLVVKCELNSEQSIIIVDGSPIHSLCTWDVEADENEEIRIFDDE